MGSSSQPDHDRAVLVVDPAESMADSFTSHARQHTDLKTTTATCLSAAHDLVANTDFAALVVHTDPLDAEACQSVADLRTHAPNTPLILVTPERTSALPNVLVSRATSIVSEPTESDNWDFLVEKIDRLSHPPSAPHQESDLYRLLVENARDGLYRLDASGHMVYLNESFAEMLGYTRSELLGVHGSEAMAEGELERGQRIIQELIEADDRESEVMDMEMTTKDGETIVVSVNFVVLTTDEGAYDGVMGIARDVTERRERKRQLERQNDRLEQFAALVSHDLRNPLNVAEGHLDLARETVDSDHLDEVASAHTRMRELIDDLLTMAQTGAQATDPEVVSLSAVVDQCWQHVAAPGASLANEATSSLRADRGQLKQLLENLMRNAVEHGSTSPDSQARQDAVEHGGDGVRVRVGELDGGAGFFVADDGPGIPADIRDQVFEARYSTEDEGTGLGLAIVEDVVDAHDWTISLTDSAAGGARFEITGVDLRE